MQNLTFDAEKMYTCIRDHAFKLDMKQTLSALAFAKEKYDGKIQKNGEPYIVYPMTIVYNALSCGLRSDETIAIILLHNVCEYRGISVDELPVNDTVKHGVELMKFDIVKGENNDTAINRYYDLLLQSREASLAKIIECCHNIFVTDKTFTQNKIRSYISEVRRNILPLLEKMKNKYPDDANILFAIKYHIVSVMNSVEATLDTYESEKWQFNSINDFHAEGYEWLSNFYPVSVEYDGLTYPSSEAAYQAQKTTDKDIRKRFTLMAAKESKEEGQLLEYRDDWDMVKQEIMYGIVRAKFTQNPDLYNKLLATGSLMLIEGNDWDDRYWGVDKYTGEGENHLGRILMRVRSELRRQ